MEPISELLERMPELKPAEASLRRAAELLIKTYEHHGKLLVCGNGGSDCDAEHIVGELMKGMLKRRPLSDELKAKLSAAEPELGPVLAEKLQTPLRAINLGQHPALSTAFGNDVGWDMIFAQQVLCFGDPDDVFIGISTSGNSRNIRMAATVAKAQGLRLIGLTGPKESTMDRDGLYDAVIHAQATEGYRIQENHQSIYHALCRTVEDHFFTK